MWQNVACWHLNTNDETGTIRGETYWIDFRVPGLSHAVVEEAEHLRVQELVQKIENRRHRAALEAVLQQNNVYYPFSKKSKEMIRELSNVELFVLCEFFFNESTMFSLSYLLESRNCVLHFRTMLVDSESRRKFHKLRLDERNLVMVFDMARPKNKKSSIRTGMHGRDAASLSRLSRLIFYGYSRSNSQRSSLSWIISWSKRTDLNTRLTYWLTFSKKHRKCLLSGQLNLLQRPRSRSLL